MSRFVAAVLSAVCLAFLSLPVVASGQDAHRLRIGFTHFAPFVFVNDDGKLTGIDVELADAACRKLGCTTPRRTQPVSKCNSPVNPGCSILRGQSTLAHSPPSPSQFFTPIANVGANSFKQRSTDRARFRFFDACSCS